MELTGRIIAVMEPRGGVSARTGNAWMTQEYVLEVPGTYPKRCVFNLFGEDRIKQFNIQNGEELTIQFDIDAREYQGRWFNDIRAYNVIRGQVQQPVAATPVGAPQSSPFPPADGATSPFPPTQEPSSEGTTDDLPF